MKFKILVEYAQQWEVTVHADSKMEAIEKVEKNLPTAKTPDVEKTSIEVISEEYTHEEKAAIADHAIRMDMDGSIFHPGCQSPD